jgi:hypothetical protein
VTLRAEKTAPNERPRAKRSPSRKPAASDPPPIDIVVPVPDFDRFVADWNTLQGQGTPDLHARIAQWLQDQRYARTHGATLLAFRSSGKSTLVGLFCAWLLAKDANLRVLVLAAEHALARKMVRNVKRIIERHPATAGLKPVKTEQWASDQFVVARGAELRDPSMLAKGLAGNITGTRADVVICDDVEVPNTCDTAAKREDLRERLGELDYILVPGGMQLYIGTPHSYYSIYAETVREEVGEIAPFLDGFARLKIPLLDENGQSVWPERYDAARITAVRKRTGPRKFQAQMMLEPVAETAGRLDPDRLLVYDDALVYSEGNDAAIVSIAGRRMSSVTCWWDPAYGSPNGDRSVVAAVFTDAVGHYWLHDIAYLTPPPDTEKKGGRDDASHYCRQVAAFAKRNRVPHVTIEQNGIGRFLPSILRRELADAGIACGVSGVNAVRAKTLRILDAFDARLAASVLHAHRDVWKTPFIVEMREWRPGGVVRDDGLDAVAGCLLAEPVRVAPVERPDSVRSWRTGGKPHRAKTDFDL